MTDESIVFIFTAEIELMVCIGVVLVKGFHALITCPTDTK